MLAKLCPSAMAVRISGQRARIWPDLVAGFFPRLCARRRRVSVIHCCSAFVYSSLLAICSTVYDGFRHSSTEFDNCQEIRQESTFFDSEQHFWLVWRALPRPKTLVVEHKGSSDRVAVWAL